MTPLREDRGDAHTVLAEEAARNLLHTLDWTKLPEEVRRNTPVRFADAWLELTSGYHEDSELDVQFAHSTSMTVQRNITFFSTCQHHLLTFFGTGHIAVVPDGKVPGLSKFSRLVHKHSARLQLQEQMGEDIADELMSKLEPNGVMVILEAVHLCARMRGVKDPCMDTVTSAIRGVFEDLSARMEALSLLGLGRNFR